VDDTHLPVRITKDLWRSADCASASNGRPVKCAHTQAQFDNSPGGSVGLKNIHAELEGANPGLSTFNSLGALCVVGHQTAMCRVGPIPFFRTKSLRFSGLLAWLMWRGIYLSKLPGIERKIRVLMDWTAELFFSPEIIVQTM